MYLFKKIELWILTYKSMKSKLNSLLIYYVNKRYFYLFLNFKISFIHINFFYSINLSTYLIMNRYSYPKLIIFEDISICHILFL